MRGAGREGGREKEKQKTAARRTRPALRHSGHFPFYLMAVFLPFFFVTFVLILLQSWLFHNIHCWFIDTLFVVVVVKFRFGLSLGDHCEEEMNDYLPGEWRLLKLLGPSGSAATRAALLNIHIIFVMEDVV